MSERVRAEWRARIAAEYGSAAITQELTLWLIQLGAPPDLIDAGLAIVADELAHSRLSHEVYEAAGGREPPAIDRATLALPRAERPVLAAAVRVFCLGETVAVPLFRHLRERCTEPGARAALDRILRDEVRHRDFGWDLLDWCCQVEPDAPAWVTAQLPAMLADLEAGYGRANPSADAKRTPRPRRGRPREAGSEGLRASENPTVAGDDGAITEDERAWGLAPPREYATILAQTIETAFRPRFAARGIALPPG